MNADVLIGTDGAVGRISLNRPKALHALTRDMCLEMTRALLSWQTQDQVVAIVIDHAEGRGFCAGGDVTPIRQSALDDGGRAGRQFFYDEYRLNHLLFTYPKPVVAFIDGIVMGGGVGISQPAQYRVVTENTRFAMPETGIGLFPDVGGGWYLSRLQGRVGQFLALTGARLDGAECLWTGLATHYLPSQSLAEAKQRIAAGHQPGGVLSSLAVDPGSARIEGNIAQIARHFASDELADVIDSLGSDDSEWAAKELATIRAKCPTSCKVALRQLANGAALSDFADNMRMEYRIAARMFMRPDFAEGVRALIIDKTDDPQWCPGTPEEVGSEMLDEIFSPLPDAGEWSPLPAAGK